MVKEKGKVSYSLNLIFLQVSQRKLCSHIHLVILARKLKENKSPPAFTQSQSKISPPSLPPPPTNDNVSFWYTLEIQKSRSLPLDIPPYIVNRVYSIKLENGNIFTPSNTECVRCGHRLGKSINQHGIESGYLITNFHAFSKIQIKMKKCLSVDCGAANLLFPYELGIHHTTFSHNKLFHIFFTSIKLMPNA